MEKIIKYKDLSGWMKVAAIGGLISLFSSVIGFCIGFLSAF